MAIITLCGSTKFDKAFEEWNVRLTLLGNTVFSIVIPSHAYQIELTQEQKDIFDKAHLHKIALSDEIFVIDVDGYIGESTQKEIDYAKSVGVKVVKLSEFYPEWKPSAVSNVFYQQVPERMLTDAEIDELLEDNQLELFEAMAII